MYVSVVDKILCCSLKMKRWYGEHALVQIFDLNFAWFCLQVWHNLLISIDFVNPRLEGYGSRLVVHSFVLSNVLREHRSLLHANEGMNRISTSMACNLTCGYCKNYFILELWLAHFDNRHRVL